MTFLSKLIVLDQMNCHKLPFMQYFCMFLCCPGTQFFGHFRYSFDFLVYNIASVYHFLHHTHCPCLYMSKSRNNTIMHLYGFLSMCLIRDTIFWTFSELEQAKQEFPAMVVALSQMRFIFLIWDIVAAISCEIDNSTGLL